MPDSPALADPVGLLGRWRFERVIHDRRADQDSRVDGGLELVEEDFGLIRWEESGTWRHPDGPVDVRRGLRLELDDPGGWWVRFEDGRDFHPWTPGTTVVHPCRPDTYRGLVDGDLELWTVTWDVSGPGKDYRMRTVLTPCSSRW